VRIIGAVNIPGWSDLPTADLCGRHMLV
jgi:hypothetical protein